MTAGTVTALPGYEQFMNQELITTNVRREPDFSTWDPIDLTPVLSAAYKPPVPAVGTRDDGLGLFYPGKIHAIGSESEGGKTWFALAAAATELTRGNTVFYYDFEDDEGGICGRLQILGISADVIRQQFDYMRPMTPLDNHDQVMLAARVTKRNPTLVIIDGVTEAMVLHGLELKDNSDIARWQALLPRPVAALGPAVVQLDHVVKDREARGRYDIGGVHKLNGIDGASFTLENRAAFGIGMTGTSGIFVRKDRPGQLRRHGLRSNDGLYWIGDFVLTSHDASFAEWSIPLPHGGGQFRPTTLMTRVSDVLQKSGPLSQRGILDRVTGKTEAVRAAIAALVDEGYIETEKGPRGAQMHKIVKQFGGTE